MEKQGQDEFKFIQLSELLNDKELKIVLDIINKKDYPQLRNFLNSIEDKLKQKGILADYLYYVLLNKFKDFDFVIESYNGKI